MEEGGGWGVLTKNAAATVEVGTWKLYVSADSPFPV